MLLQSTKQAMTESKRNEEKKKQDFCSASITRQPPSLLTSSLKETKIVTDWTYNQCIL